MTTDDLHDPLFDHVRSDDAVNGVIDGLRTAMEATDGAEYQAIINSRHTRKIINKLLHCGVEWADLDVQHSWHTYGSDYRNDAPDAAALEPTALDEIPSPDEPVVDSPEREYPSQEDFHEFYLNLRIGSMDGLAEVFQTIDDDFYEFLEQFYRQYAPPEYRELYLQNVTIQRRLDEHSGEVDVHTIDSVDRREFGRTITQIHQELSGKPLFEDVLPKFIQFTDILEDVYRRFEAIDSPFELDQAPSAGISELERFYRRFAWKWVAELISKETATGLDAEEIRAAVKDDEIPELEEAYDDRLEDLEDQLLEWGQLPTGAETFSRPQSAELDRSLEQVATSSATLSEDKSEDDS